MEEASGRTRMSFNGFAGGAADKNGCMQSYGDQACCWGANYCILLSSPMLKSPRAFKAALYAFQFVVR